MSCKMGYYHIADNLETSIRDTINFAGLKLSNLDKAEEEIVDEFSK